MVSPNSRWGQLESISDIDGMLFEFFMNFLNIEKNKILRIIFVQNFMFSSSFMLFPTLKKFGAGVDFFSKFWEYKPIISHLMFSSCFFVCWKYWKVPLHLQLLVKWEVVSPNSRYRAFYHEIGNIEKCPFTYWLNGGGGFSKS